MWPIVYLLNCILAFGLSLVLTRAAIAVSNRWQIVDHPGERKIHGTAVPVLGWTGIVGGVAGTILVNLLALRGLHAFGALPASLSETIGAHLPGISRKMPQLIGILCGGVFIALAGFYDDKKKLSAGAKLAVQVVAALILLAAGVRITLFVPGALVGALLTVLWVVTVINAFNLMDNMDGLAGGVAAIACLIFFCSVSAFGQFFVSTLLAIFIGSLLGFLRYNVNPARIFMGDGGSMFTGYMIAALTIVSTFYNKAAPTHFPVVMPLVILAVPLYDTLSVIVIRVGNRKPVYVGDTNHFSHRLVALGFSERGAVSFIYLVTFCAGVSALYLPSLSLPGALLVCAQTAAVLVIVAVLEYAGKKRLSNEKKM